MLENDEDALWWQDDGIKTCGAWRVVWKIVQKIEDPSEFAQAVTVFQNRQIFQNLIGHFLRPLEVADWLDNVPNHPLARK